MGKSLVIKGSNFADVRTDVVILLPEEARGNISDKVIVHSDDNYIKADAAVGNSINQWMATAESGIHRLLEVRIRNGFRYTGSVSYDRGSGFMTAIVVDAEYNILQIGQVKSTGGAASITFDFTPPTDAFYIMFTTLWNAAESVQVIESEIND